jgi:hypothetical protein
MNTTRCSDNEYDNARMTAASYEILAIETYRWNDGHTETEILWTKEEQPIAASEVPY